ncbi:NlpC/P60 family protein [Streptomyces sp. TG1A-8]|uniref:C40 family peptidase n=1 Tax=Streptomyces sp. TG1A-8 TaxID=3051385 RepID=UPI00265BF7C6|nr:C40 family peptidase [Streptomyces sp. TG1A-8]MDO0926144.1 NlpC/P60 family protein [Streptomyces sp. TG1A-8]
MASHRKPRPGGTRGAVVRTSPALATAAFTSVAVLSHAAEAAPAPDGRPSREEIERKIEDFYRRAESAAEPQEAAGARTGRPRERADVPREGVRLPDGPRDYFDQSRVMDRLASTVRRRQETARTRATPVVAPAEAPNGPKTAKAAAQRKLASARALLAREAARGTAPPPGRSARGITPSAAPADLPTDLPAGKAVAFARAQIGKPYVWGAAGPGSYDCSGLTQAAWKAAGVALPRTAAGQARAGTAVTVAEARPGDLVFFGGAHHVGLYLGGGMMVHAPGPGAYVCEEPVHHGGETPVHSVVRPA